MLKLCYKKTLCPSFAIHHTVIYFEFHYSPVDVYDKYQCKTLEEVWVWSRKDDIYNRNRNVTQDFEFTIHNNSQ